MEKNCENCKYKELNMHEQPCEACYGIGNLWEPMSTQYRPIKTTAYWWHVTDPPDGTTFAVVSFVEPIVSGMVDTAWYFPENQTWKMSNPELEGYTPEFYIPIKDLNVPNYIRH